MVPALGMPSPPFSWYRTAATPSLVSVCRMKGFAWSGLWRVMGFCSAALNHWNALSSSSRCTLFLSTTKRLVVLQGYWIWGCNCHPVGQSHKFAVLRDVQFIYSLQVFRFIARWRDVSAQVGDLRLCEFASWSSPSLLRCIDMVLCRTGFHQSGVIFGSSCLLYQCE